MKISLNIHFNLLTFVHGMQKWVKPGNTKGGNITVPLTSCSTGLDKFVLQIKITIVSCPTADSKPVKQEVNGTAILPPLVFPG
jgi:hypothetical protein